MGACEGGDVCGGSVVTFVGCCDVSPTITASATPFAANATAIGVSAAIAGVMLGAVMICSERSLERWRTTITKKDSRSFREWLAS